MNRVSKIFILLLFLITHIVIKAQSSLMITGPTGLKIIVIQKEFPLLKIILSNQLLSERGIEVEFPEHVTGLNQKSHTVEHLYLVTNGAGNKRTLPVWHVEGNNLIYETDLGNMIKMIATASVEEDGIRYTYKLTNHSNIPYVNLQAVTCIKLYSDFSDTLLQRTYIHHPDGFDLMASETPERLIMPLQKWLPCRYLVSYTWPVNQKRIIRDEDGITKYYKSRKADMPLIATISHDKKWIAATYTKETGNLWTNPERTCQHVDPAIDLKEGETKILELKTFIIKGGFNQLLKSLNNEIKTHRKE